MKKILIIVLILLVAVMIPMIGVASIQANIVDIPTPDEGKVIFEYEEADICLFITNEELKLIANIFNGKTMYKDNPSCDFSESVAVQLDNSHTFCIARDGCPVVYWKEENRYFSITEEEKINLHNLLKSFGVYFPCI